MLTQQCYPSDSQNDTEVIFSGSVPLDTWDGGGGGVGTDGVGWGIAISPLFLNMIDTSIGLLYFVNKWLSRTQYEYIMQDMLGVERRSMGHVISS